MKILKIDNCDHCFYFDNAYLDYERWCGKLDRIIKYNPENCRYPIPSDCPLEEVLEEIKD